MLLSTLAVLFPAQVGFLAVKGNGYSSDIALDDVSISRGLCMLGDDGTASEYGKNMIFV